MYCSGWRGYYISATACQSKKYWKTVSGSDAGNCSWNDDSEENLALAAGKGGWLSIVPESDKQRFREQLALLDIGLEDRMNHPVGLLSGGQRQALTL